MKSTYRPLTSHSAAASHQEQYAFFKKCQLIDAALQEKKMDGLELMVKELYPLANKIDTELRETDPNDATYAKKVDSLQIKVLLALANHATDQHDYQACALYYTKMIWLKPFKADYYSERSKAYGKLDLQENLSNDIVIIRELKRELPNFLTMNAPAALTAYFRASHSEEELEAILKDTEKALDLYHGAYEHFYKIKLRSTQGGSDSSESLIAFLQNQMGVLCGHSNRFDVAHDCFAKAFAIASKLKNPVMMSMSGINQVIACFHLYSTNYIKSADEAIKTLVNTRSYVDLFKKRSSQDAFLKQHVDIVTNLSKRFFLYHMLLIRYPHWKDKADLCIDLAVDILKGFPVQMIKIHEYYNHLGTHCKGEKAIAIYTESIRKLEQHEEAKQHGSLIESHYFARACIYDQMNLHDKALDDYMSVVKLNRKNQQAAERIAVLIKQHVLTSEPVATKPRQEVVSEAVVLPLEEKEVALSALPASFDSVPQAPSQTSQSPLAPPVDKEKINAKKLEKIRLYKEQLAKLNNEKLIEISERVAKTTQIEADISGKLKQVDHSLQVLIDESSKDTRIPVDIDPIRKQRALASDMYLKINADFQYIHHVSLKAKTTIQLASRSLSKIKRTFTEIQKQLKLFNGMVDQINTLIEKEKTTYERAQIAYAQETQRLAEEKRDRNQIMAIAATFSKRDFERLLALNNALQKLGFAFSIHGGTVTKYAMHLFAKTLDDKNSIRGIKLNDIDIVIESKSIHDPALNTLLTSESFGFKSANGKSNPYFVNYKVTYDHVFDLTVRDSTHYQSHNPLRLTRAFLTFSGSQLILHDPNHELQNGLNKREFEIDLPDPRDPFIKSFFAILLKNRYKFELHDFKIGKNARRALYDADWLTSYFTDKFKQSGQFEVTSDHPCVAEIADIVKKGYFLSHHAKHIITSFIETYCAYCYDIRDSVFADTIYKNLVAFYQSYNNYLEVIDSSLLKTSILYLVQSHLFPGECSFESLHALLVSSIHQAITGKISQSESVARSSVQGLSSAQGMFKQMPPEGPVVKEAQQSQVKNTQQVKR